MADKSPNEGVVDPYEHFKIVLNPDGTITRRTHFPIVPTSEDELSDPVVTKDVTLNAEKKTWVRIFRPTKLPNSNDNKVVKLPIIVYFHGGFLMLYSVATVIYHEPCKRYANELPSIVVSVEFRLAPENRLTAAFEDAEEAMIWIKKQALDSNGDQWLRDYGDFSRCYLMGCSTGANIAYHTGLYALMDLDLEPVKIVGLILNQPLFGGEQRTRSEKKLVNDAIMPLVATDLVWELSLPIGTNRDHEYCNPMTKGAQYEKIESLPRCLVRGFCGDPTLDRQMELVRTLIKRGVQVTAHFDDIGFHCIDYVDPKRHLIMLKLVKDFIDQ